MKIIKSMAMWGGLIGGSLYLIKVGLFGFRKIQSGQAPTIDELINL